MSRAAVRQICTLTMPATHNILVISDLHLGEDLSPSANAATVRHVDLVERQLVAFFRHYTRRRRNGRPWRVVINGDMVDYMSITILPTQPELRRLVADRGDDDDEFGLRRTINTTIAKTKMVGERHAELFATMARFASRGNSIDIICGNHDVEFHWPEVQAAFRDEIAKAYQTLPDAERTGAATRSDFDESVRFHPWFFYEPGVAWIEHGHQYDENCSFEYGLNPLHPVRTEILANVDTASTRYLTNYVREIDAHAQEDWSMMGYMRFGFGLGMSGTGRLAKGYFNFARALLAERKATLGPRARRRRRAGHRELLDKLGKQWSIEQKTLSKLDGLRRTPVVSSMKRLARVLMLDKLLVGFVALLALLVCLLVFGFAWGSVAGLAFALAGVLFVHFLDRGREVDPAGPLKLVPQRILEHIEADYVVFGHTHKPVRAAIEGGGTYFNTGTWLPSGKPGLLRAFTHVVINHTATGPEAELCQWRDGASRPFAPAGFDAAGDRAGEAVASRQAHESAASTGLPR